MTKMPWMQLWIEDIDRDCNALSIAARGAWVWMLFDLRKHGGTRSLTVKEWAQVVRTSEAEFSTALDELSQQGICDVSVTKALPGNARKQKNNALVTVTSRRLVREAKDRNQNTLRQRRFKARHRGNAKNNGTLTPEIQIQITEAEADVCVSSSGRRVDERRQPPTKNTYTHTPAADELLTPEMREWVEAAAPDLDPEEQAEMFLDHHRAKGDTSADWAALFRNWVRIAIERQTRAPTRRETVEEHNRRVLDLVEAMTEHEIRVMQGLED